MFVVALDELGKNKFLYVYINENHLILFHVWVENAAKLEKLVILNVSQASSDI